MSRVPGSKKETYDAIRHQRRIDRKIKQADRYFKAKKGKS